MQVRLVYNFLHDENEEDLIFVRMLLTRRPWEAPSNQVTNTWQAFTEAIRIQQDSKGNFPFQNIAAKTLRSRYNGYLGLEQYWTEKVDPEDLQDQCGNVDGKPPSPSQEIRNGIHDLLEMVRNFNDAKVAERDGLRLKDWMEKGQVQEMKAKALLHLDQAFDGAVAASKSRVPSGFAFDSTVKNGSVLDIPGNEDDATSFDDSTSQTNSPDGLNPIATPSRRTSKTRKGTHAILELEKIQKNFQELKERKAQNRIELLKEREKRKRKEADTAQLEQENTRLRLELQNTQIQANITLQQQMMEQQLQMQQQMMTIFSRLTSTNKQQDTTDGSDLK